MKQSLPLCIAIFLCWLGLHPMAYAQFEAGAQDSIPLTGEPQKHIRVYLEYIEVSHDLFTDLIFGADISTSDVLLRQKLARLTKEGKASVIETMLCTAISGQKATAESIEEVVYPTEYDAAILPEKKEPKEGEDPQKVEAERFAAAIGPQPTSFEPRNTGSTLEVESKLNEDKKIVELRLSPEIVYHTGNKVWAEWKGKQGGASVQMPKFYVMRFHTTVSLAYGQIMLVAAQTPNDKDGSPDPSRKLMVFVKADVIESKP